MVYVAGNGAPELMSHQILDTFALLDTQVTRLHAELQADPRTLPDIRAQVEIKLTPVKPERMTTPLPTYQITATLAVRGLTSGDPEKPAFTIDCVMNALYRQTLGEAMPFAEFSASHRALTRQLYPLMHHQLLPLIRQLGLQQVRLPHDIVHRPEPESTTTPSAPTMH